MVFLRQLFSQPQETEMPRDALARLFAPLMPDPDEHSNHLIATALEETAEWLRIGFDSETEKGSLYHAAHYALRSMAGTVRQSTEETPHFALKTEHLSLLRTAACQLGEAALRLESMSAEKANYAPTYVQDRQGNILTVPFIQIYNRPNAAHGAMGERLRMIAEKLETYFTDSAVKPAGERQIGRVPMPPR